MSPSQQTQGQLRPITISSEAQPKIRPQAIPVQQTAQMQVQGQGITMHMVRNMQGFPPTNTILALVLACVSLVFGGICLSIPSLILANGALRITSQHPGHPDQPNAKVARIVSIISIIIYTIFIIIYAIYMVNFIATERELLYAIGLI